MTRRGERGRPFYLGGYTGDGAVGLLVAEQRDGELADAHAVDVRNPSWLARSGDRLYAVDESSPDGAVTALSLDDPARPAVLNTQPSEGDSPTHCTVFGGHLVTANYGSGSLVVHPVEDDGRLGAPTDLVAHGGDAHGGDAHGGDAKGGDAHAHQVVADPSGRWLVAVDIGMDTVYVYGLTGGRLTEHARTELPAGSGPRHLCWHPGGRLGYLVHEYESVITVVAWDAEAGALSAGQVVGTRPAAARGDNAPAEVLVSDDGRYVYATNRGDNTLARLSVHGERLRFEDAVDVGGDWPRHAVLSGEHAYVANQRSGSVTWLRRDATSGELSAPEGSLRATAVSMVLPG